MRYILLATTALFGVAFAGAAQASGSASPISLNVGGYNDFIAGYQHGGAAVPAGGDSVGVDFEDEFKISFDALGKAPNGMEYGANVSLWNGAEASNGWSGGTDHVTVSSAYVWMSGAFGKVLMGDEHGASDLMVYAPTVGEGQIDGRYGDFISSSHIAAPMIRASGMDNTEHSTKITYYTPKVGNDLNKIQVGVSYAPSLYNYGQSISKTSASNHDSPYQDVIEGVVQYTGTFQPVNVTASLDWTHGTGGKANLSSTAFGDGLSGAVGQARDFDAFGVGAQVAFDGFTLGGAYHSIGHYNTIAGQTKPQNSFNLGGKYEFDKVGVALNYIHGKGYDNLLTGGPDGAVSATTNYVKKFEAAGAGATYTWFPGLTSNVDGVVYGQTVSDQAGKQGGYSLLVSQRLAF